LRYNEQKPGQIAPQEYFLGNCSSVIAPALPYYTLSMVLCVALPPTLTSMDGGNAKELFGTILAM